MWVSLLTLATVIVMVAVVIAVPAVLRSPQNRPLAPGLAALDGTELATMLPTTPEFPTGWSVQQSPAPSDVFGFTATTAASSRMAKCFPLFAESLAPPPFAAAGVQAYSPDDPEHLDVDLRITVHREFDTETLDRRAALTADCESFGDEATHCTVAVLERDLDHLRYTVTRIDRVDGDEGAEGAEDSEDAKDAKDAEEPVARVRYFSYARNAGLLVAGYADGNSRDLLDTLMAGTMERIAARSEVRP
ncbi:hypothetical protein MKOR_26900 [Mycolicibacillus koreensis]|uniref:Uncharacterized protein n=1 Tax=Mycolicibacillus koreensis TaxID=1069220 RepID=A0A7I7SGT3_9MYCO|nr:hypothetical protein B8W67_12510 [Mycolicibacillus koreensis]BBY55439.1 hypothetical protein MKOR_26900 [Mycolicibacillus koreensis]